MIWYDISFQYESDGMDEPRVTWILLWAYTSWVIQLANSFLFVDILFQP